MISVIFIFICVMAVSVVLFGFWIVSAIVKTILKLINSSVQLRSPTTAGRHCMNAGCRTTNPTHANFCRRCGSSLNVNAMTNHQASIRPRYNPQNGRGRQVASI